jgi:hypothetical protein
MTIRYFLKKWESLNQELLEQQQESTINKDKEKKVV